jgi:acetyl esterase/lipase
MRKTIAFIFLMHSLSAQRYLKSVFPDVDVKIAQNYGTALDYRNNSQNLLFDFYSPKNDTLQKRPLIIYIHGGGFNSGSRDYASIKILITNLAKKGYAVASIDYRLDPAFDIYNSTKDRRAMTDAMHDTKQAIRFFKANAEKFKINSEKIFLGGESAGAVIALMASYIDKQNEMSAYPMAKPNDPVGNMANANFSNSVAATMCLCGLLLDTLAIENPQNSPLLWTHGTEDKFIPISLAFNVVKRAANVGLPISTKVYNGATHCPWYFGNPKWEKYLDSTTNDITYFLYPKVTNLAILGNENIPEEKIRIYPNPSYSSIYVDFYKPFEKIEVALIDNTGKIFLLNIFQNSNKITLKPPSIPDGLYYLRFTINNQIQINRKISILKE